MENIDNSITEIEWKDFVGDFVNLFTPAIEKEMNNQMKLLIIKQIDDFVKIKIDDDYWEEDRVFTKFMNFDELYKITQDPPPRGQKAEDYMMELGFSYNDPEAPVWDEVETWTKGVSKITKKRRKVDGKNETAPGLVAKKDYCKIGVQIRKAMIFLIAQFYNTVHHFYFDKKRIFPDITEFYEIFREYAKINKDNSPAYAIISLFEMNCSLDIEYEKFKNIIMDPIMQIYTDPSKNDLPEEEILILNLIYEYVIHFIKIVSSLVANQIFEKKKNIDLYTIHGALRTINSMFVMNSKDAYFSESILDSITQYATYTKPKNSIPAKNVDNITSSATESLESALDKIQSVDDIDIDD